MIWHSILNVLTALLRNAFQKGHRCLRLDGGGFGQWEWDCSCGAWGAFHHTELSAIQDYSRHVNHSPKASRRFRESVSIEGLVKK